MSTYTPEEQLSNRIGEAISQLKVDSTKWALENFLYGGTDSDMRFSEELSYHRNEIKRAIGVEPLEAAFLGEFLCSSIGKNCLKLPELRALLVRHELTISPKRRFRLLSLFGLDRDLEYPIIESVKTMSWRMGSSLTKRFLNELRLPSSLSESSASGSRRDLEIINPFRAPSPLMEFQEIVKDGALASLSSGGSCLIVMPTGSGKTRTAIQTLGEHILENNSDFNGIIWIADRDELCGQAAESFSALLPFVVEQPVPMWRYWGGSEIALSESDEGIFVEGIVVTSHQQLQRRLARNDPTAEAILDSAKAIVIDEAHRWIEWNERLISEVGKINPSCKIVGLTATPYRRETRENSRLISAYGRNLITPHQETMRDPDFTLRKLTEEGVLARRIDLSPTDLGVEISSDTTPWIRTIEGLDLIRNLLGVGRKSLIVFTESVEQARQLSVCLNIEGIKSAYLDADTPSNSRRKTIARFRDQEITVLLNYMILTTGFDSPRIDAVLVLRRNNREDLPVINQMIGRGLRGPLFGGTDDCYVVLR